MPLSKLVRRIHLFMALFLTPWVLMYAISTITMHHRLLFTGESHRVAPDYVTVSESDYALPDAIAGDRQAAASRILADLDLEGAFFVQGSLEDGTLTVHRERPIWSYRIRYDVEPGRLHVERQKFGLAYVLEMLHRRRGFQQSFLTNDLWAVIVDGVIAAILLWAATGLWMWWEMVKTRKLGAASLLVGIGLFVLFLFTL